MKAVVRSRVEAVGSGVIRFGPGDAVYGKSDHGSFAECTFAPEDALETGQLTTVIDRTYPLARSADALGHVQDGHTRGKTIIAVIEPRRDP